MMNNFVFFKRNYALLKVNVDDIVVIEVRKNELYFYLADCYHVVRSTLQSALSLLPERQFVQVHRSYAVSVNHISKIEDLQVHLKDFEEKVPMSRQYYRDISKQIFILEAEVPGKKKPDLKITDTISHNLEKLTAKPKKKASDQNYH